MPFLKRHLFFNVPASDWFIIKVFALPPTKASGEALTSTIFASLPCVTKEMAVALQFRVLQSAIEFIKTTANQEPQKLSGSVNAPSSPHHAMYQKRKSIAGEYFSRM